MTVYIEYVIIDNVVIDYLMLKATFALTGIRSSRGRLFLCSFFGAAVALIYPLIESVTAISVVLKILSGLLIVCLAAKYNTVKSYYINAVVFFCFTFLTGGAIIGVFSILSIPYSAELSVALMAIPAYFIIRAVSEVLKFVYRRKDVVKLTYKLDLTLLGRVVPAVGFLDTGNALYDGDNAVIVTDKKFFLALAGDNLIKLKLKKLTVKTVLSSGENFAVSLDELKIYIEDKVNIYNNVTLLVVSKGVGEGYDVILHPALFRSSYDESLVEKVKEVS